MLLPKRVKYRRVHRGRMTGKALRGNKVTYGDFGLQATEPAWITSNQIEAARVAMTRYCKRFGKVWIKIFPDKPVTAKPAEENSARSVKNISAKPEIHEEFKNARHINTPEKKPEPIKAEAPVENFEVTSDRMSEIDRLLKELEDKK